MYIYMYVYLIIDKKRVNLDNWLFSKSSELVDGDGAVSEEEEPAEFPVDIPAIPSGGGGIPYV